MSTRDPLTSEPLQRAARAAGIVDVDALRMGDASRLTFDKHGRVSNAKAFVAGLKKAKPYLFPQRSRLQRAAALARLIRDSLRQTFAPKRR